MSTWKGNGKLKDPMKRWNLYEFVQHHERRPNSYVAKCRDILGPLIKSNQPYSKFVLDKMNDAMGLSSEYKVSLLNKHLHHQDPKIDGNVYSVQRKGEKASIYTMSFLHMIPTFTCHALAGNKSYLEFPMLI